MDDRPRERAVPVVARRVRDRRALDGTHRRDPPAAGACLPVPRPGAGARLSPHSRLPASALPTDATRISSCRCNSPSVGRPASASLVDPEDDLPSSNYAGDFETTAIPNYKTDSQPGYGLIGDPEPLPPRLGTVLVERGGLLFALAFAA